MIDAMDFVKKNEQNFATEEFRIEELRSDISYVVAGF
jgi:hypothetical protein